MSSRMGLYILVALGAIYTETDLAYCYTKHRTIVRIHSLNRSDVNFNFLTISRH